MTIANFSHLIEANLAKTRLESAGIECFLTNEHIVSMNWFWSNAVGGVGVQVRAADVDSAIEALQGDSNGADSEEARAGDDSSEIRCPKCRSKNVYYEKLPLSLVIASLFLLGLPLLFFKRERECLECRHQFR